VYYRFVSLYSPNEIFMLKVLVAAIAFLILLPWILKHIDEGECVVEGQRY
jgi:hypothetical protein